MLDIVLVLAVFGTLLVVVALSQPLAARLRLAPVVLLAVIGVAMGAVSGFLLHGPLSNHFGEFVRLFADLPLGSETFIYVFLPLLVFEAALTSDVRRILEDAAPILMLAVVATLVTAAIVGLALWPFAGAAAGRLPAARRGRLDDRPRRGHRDLPRRRGAGAPDRGWSKARPCSTTRRRSCSTRSCSASSSRDVRPLLGTRRGSNSSAPSSAARLLGALAGRALLSIIPWTRDDRLAEGTLTVALAYLAFIAAQRLFDVSGVVAVLAAGLTVSAFGRTRIAPYNWSFLTDLWEQIAFWAHSLVFLLASILVPRLLFDMQLARPRAGRRPDRRGLRRPARGAVPPAAAAEPREAHAADQHRLQARHRLGRPEGRAHPGAGALGHRKSGACRPRCAASSRCWRPASCCSRCSSTARRSGRSSACSGSTACRRSISCCATGCSSSPMPRRAR